MKTKILFGCLGFMFLILMGGCDKPDEECPRILSESQDYQLPEIKLLTLEEREEVRLLKEEYNNAIQDL